MLDIKLLRRERERCEAKLRSRDPAIDLSRLLSCDERAREIQTEVERLKSERNDLSRRVGELKREGKEAGNLLGEAAQLGERIELLDHELSLHLSEIERELSALPNLPLDEVAASPDPKDNVLVKEWGKKPTFAFTPRHHVEIGEQLGLFDFKRGARMSGSGWPIYKGFGARLEWALIQYMLDFHIKRGFEMWLVPHALRAEAMYGSGQLPKFESQLFKITDKDYHLFLIPTAEVALNAVYQGEILPEEELPKRLVSYTPCFRREAGAAGAQERGLIRVHQFNKVEMFCFCRPEESEQIHQEMIASAEALVQSLGLHYRLMLLVTGDLGVAAAKTVDLEVYLPGQGRYYEVSSLSSCTDYQARRSDIRFRREGQKPEFVHTLNGSGLATSRLMVAILENNQLADGTVCLPEALQPYLGGIDRLRCP